MYIQMRIPKHPFNCNPFQIVSWLSKFLCTTHCPISLLPSDLYTIRRSNGFMDRLLQIRHLRPVVHIVPYKPGLPARGVLCGERIVCAGVGHIPYAVEKRRVLLPQGVQAVDEGGEICIFTAVPVEGRYEPLEGVPNDKTSHTCRSSPCVVRSCQKSVLSCFDLL